MGIFRTLTILATISVSSARAEWIELPWPALDATLPIWKPDNFDASKKYPAVVYYHGTGGQPNATLIHEATGGEDFVLVGMTYRHKGRFEYSDAEIADELGLLGALKKTLGKSLSVDPTRIYVGGFSKGGWHSAMLLDRDRELAGGLILGGGVFEKRKSPPKFSAPVPIYIGCGRYDGNYPPSLGAYVYFRKMAAEVTLDVWPGLAHSQPDAVPESMRQWLRIQAAPEGLRAEAEEWISAAVGKISVVADPVEQWFAYDEFLTLPFVKAFGADSETKAKAEMESLLANPAVATEKKWRDESRRILVRESGDRLLTTLQSASQAHHQLAEKASGTRAAEEAVRDFERTQELLKTAKVVQLRGKKEVERIAPETAPSAPSGNLDRGPFFPPGIRVKPAK